MTKFKTLNERTKFRLEKIVKYFMQATPNTNTVTFYYMHTNDIGTPNESSEIGMLLGNGDRISLSTYVYEVIPDKLVHYSLYEFKWSNGSPVLRPVPLINNPSVRREQQDAFVDMNIDPKAIVDYWYKRIELVFNIDLDTF